MAEGIIAHDSHYVRTLLWSNNAPVASGTNIELSSLKYMALNILDEHSALLLGKNT
jgi:hypothetical protein